VTKEFQSTDHWFWTLFEKKKKETRKQQQRVWNAHKEIDRENFPVG